MRAAVEALTLGGPASIAIAVPTAHADAVKAMSTPVETEYCANVRAGWSFAVADAYEKWSDVSEDQATTLLRACRRTA